MNKNDKIHAIIELARSQIGARSSANDIIYNTWYYGEPVSGSYYAWCCTFICWLFNEAGFPELFYSGKKVAYCPFVESWAIETGIWHKTGLPGDLCLMDFDKGRASHIGIVEIVNSDGSYTTIEGNTSDNESPDAGGVVCRKIRYPKNILGFVRWM